MIREALLKAYDKKLELIATELAWSNRHLMIYKVNTIRFMIKYGTNPDKAIKLASGLVWKYEERR